jgi:hypothetical protein
VTFRARLRRQSAVWNLWTNHNRLGGRVCGVQFSQTLPGEYVTVELDAYQVSALRGHEGVLLEAMTQPLAAEPMAVLAPRPASMDTPVWTPPVVEQAKPRGVVEQAKPRVPVTASPVPQARPQSRRSPMPPPVPEVAPPPAPLGPMTAEERRADRQRRLAAANKRTKFDKYG